MMCSPNAWLNNIVSLKMRLKAVVNKIGVSIALLMIAPFTHAALDCQDVSHGSDKYHDNMEKLAIEARLPDNYYNRYHQSAVSDLCAGNNESLDNAIDYGYIKRSEVEALRESLGLDVRSIAGSSYEYSRQTFSRLGLSSAESDHVAQFYTKQIDSECGQLAKKALEGNPRAIAELQDDPDYCHWSYNEQ